MNQSMARSTVLAFTIASAWALTSCGIATYPGQPGVKTNGESRLDFEVLDEDGLWIYETSYDNSPGGGGVESITTRLYPEVYTYSSNARSNSDGTFYRHKLPYRGSQIQMISFPKEGTIFLPEDSKVLLTVDYDISMDEVDDRNLSEEGIFAKSFTNVSSALATINWRLQTLNKAKLASNGALNYVVQSLQFGEEMFLFENPALVQSNIVQSGINLQFSPGTKQKLASWLETTFPEGFNGMVKATVNGGKVIEKKMSLNTPATLQRKGVRVSFVNNLQTIWNQKVQKSNKMEIQK
ncbi:MAG: hypothetical protein HRU19_18405 [Pseudobacteriovorax sp.]|nr:hypothetical protein [Pseudobacteriovorax sp.]